VAHPGEFVHLVREPDNPFDRNAIRVDNMRLEKVGHIKATFAKTLAPMMDALNVNPGTSTIHLDGTIRAEGNGYSLPLEIDFFSRTMCGLSDFARVNGKFQCYHQEWNPNQVFAATMQQKSERIEVLQQTIKWEAAQENLDTMFDQLLQDQLLNLPAIEVPPSLTTRLLDHQMEGIRWMYHKEQVAMETRAGDEGNPVDIPFYKKVQERGRFVWFCEITNSTQALPPAPIKGSIL
jgi:SWI/SNF-related matrix-associated actin-dependent regulator of chromatin subfamily A3